MDGGFSRSDGFVGWLGRRRRLGMVRRLLNDGVGRGVFRSLRSADRLRSGDPASSQSSRDETHHHPSDEPSAHFGSFTFLGSLASLGSSETAGGKPFRFRQIS